MSAPSNNASASTTEYVTVTIGDHLFGLPISRVRDVFVLDRLTRVPLAPPEVAGILNLRGRVVTAIDMRSRLDFGANAPGSQVMAIGIEFRGESYGLLVDAVGEVMPLADSERQAKPSNLDPRLARVAAGVFRLDGQLLVELDVDSVLDIKSAAAAA